ncbi:hypothetical protein ElyMa_004634800 [Elysia marginata]|uniref:Uncharacterized protein n=1 Tax=Elysia marginata TaxID=1093978 RepID=A0AAV4I4H9_9GAST|nr:hypothetical protein ElyMa_004634800 [Elysia marginata]
MPRINSRPDTDVNNNGLFRWRPRGKSKQEEKKPGKEKNESKMSRSCSGSLLTSKLSVDVRMSGRSEWQPLRVRAGAVKLALPLGLTGRERGGVRILQV